MPFPPSDRVVYAANPLVEVICQVRFPPILKIDSEIPARFQERIRQRYPLFQEKQEKAVNVDLPQEILGVLGLPPILGGRLSREFLSEDEVWKVGLTREFIAVSTHRYERWEIFKDQLMVALNPFIEEYAPAFVSRVGLRYRDLIKRSRLNLADVAWGELLNGHITGELSTEVAPDIESLLRQALIKLEDGQGHVQIQHGLAPDKKTGEICYVIDSDFYTEQRLGVNDVVTRLDYFNRQSGRLFRWCITDRLHAALGPQVIHGN